MKTAYTVAGGGVVATLAAAATMMGIAWQGMPGSAAQWQRSALQLTAPDAADDDHFGHCVAMEGELALVGAWLNDSFGLSSGAAYLFQRGRDVPVAKLGEADTETQGRFGESVALCGRTALVGKPGDDHAGDSSGAAYLYRVDAQGTWSRVARLVAEDAAAGDQFGQAVALDEGVVLVGTRGNGNSGTVYVFQEDAPGAWRQVAKLAPDKRVSNDQFGWALAIDGDLAVVGASADSSGPRRSYAGAAYLFQRGGSRWKQVAKLTAPERKHHQVFGRAVALHGRTVLVGAPGHDNCQGTVYVFQEGGNGAWQAVSRLVPREAVARAQFGRSVAGIGGMIAVGAPAENAGVGAVYLFQDDGAGTWQQTARLTTPGDRADGWQTNWFGDAVALNGDWLLAGAHCGHGNTTKSGTAFLFRVGGL